VSLAPKRLADSEVTLQHFMMPEHANPQGNVHGGVLMKLVDEAAAICAMRYSQRPTVTVAIDSMSFKSPVHVGELVALHASKSRIGLQRRKSRRILRQSPMRNRTVFLPANLRHLSGRWITRMAR
jgi:uncharacterized protein (TIGR00369 family)